MPIEEHNKVYELGRCPEVTRGTQGHSMK